MVGTRHGLRAAALVFCLLQTALLVPASGGTEATRPGPLQPEIETWTRADAAAALQEGRIEEVRAWATREIEQADQPYGSDPGRLADAVEVMLEVLFKQGYCADDEVVAVARRAVAAREAQFGNAAIELVTPLRRLGTLSPCQPHGTPEARAEFLRRSRLALTRALMIAEAHSGPDSPELLPILKDLARCEWDWGSLDASRSLWDRVIGLQQAGLTSDEAAWRDSLYQAARMAYFDGDLERATEYLRRFLATSDDTHETETSTYASALNLKGLIAMAGGDYVAAQRELEASLALRRRVNLPSNSSAYPEIGSSFLNLGLLHRLLGDLETARGYAARAVDWWMTTKEDGDADVALARTSLGNILTDLGELQLAREQFELGLAALARTGWPHPYRPALMLGRGRLLLRRGDYERAVPLLEETLALLVTRYGEQHPEVADVLALLAEADEAMARLGQARGRLAEAARIRATLLGADHPLLADALRRSAAVAGAMGLQPEAVALALRACRIRAQHLRLTARALPEALALRYAAATRQSFDTLLTVAAHASEVESWEEVLDAVIRSRAVVLDEMALRRRHVSTSGDPGIAKLLSKEADTARRLAALLFAGPQPGASSAGYRRLVEAARVEHEVVTRELAATGYAAMSGAETSQAGVEELRRALPAGSALVAFVRFEGRGAGYAALVLPAGSNPVQFVHLGSVDGVERLVQAWRNAAGARPPVLPTSAARSETSYRDAGQALRAAIWDPLLPAIRGAERIFLVPDGAIHLVSLDTLPMPDGRYLLERGPVIQYLTAERDLLRPSRPADSRSELLALGGPDFDLSPSTRELSTETRPGLYRGPSSTCADFQSLQFEPIPFAAKEATEVASSWDGDGSGAGRAARVVALTGAGATETAFKMRAPQSDLLHVATHGFFFGGHCANATAVPAEESPLLRAGLVFAGANRRTEMDRSADQDDGILTAEEIAAMDLARVEWAVLSACETGLGEVASGEGVQGLRRAFELAGAGTVVMSLWQVSDDSSRAWMNELYRQRRAGKPAAEAVREASRRVLESRRAAGLGTHPFHWGPFVAVGAGR